MKNFWRSYNRKRKMRIMRKILEFEINEGDIYFNEKMLTLQKGQGMILKNKMTLDEFIGYVFTPMKLLRDIFPVKTDKTEFEDGIEKGQYIEFNIEFLSKVKKYKSILTEKYEEERRQNRENLMLVINLICVAITLITVFK